MNRLDMVAPAITYIVTDRTNACCFYCKTAEEAEEYRDLLSRLGHSSFIRELWHKTK